MGLWRDYTSSGSMAEFRARRQLAGRAELESKDMLRRAVDIHELSNKMQTECAVAVNLIRQFNINAEKELLHVKQAARYYNKGQQAYDKKLLIGEFQELERALIHLNAVYTIAGKLLKASDLLKKETMNVLNVTKKELQVIR